MPLCSLIYHNICEHDADVAFDPFQIAVTRVNFSSQVEMLQNEFQIIGQEQIEEAIDPQSKLGDRNCILLTFDDGYCAGLSFVASKLRGMGIRALAFIPPGHIDAPSDIYWWDKLTAMLSAGFISRNQCAGLRAIASKLKYVEAADIVAKQIEHCEASLERFKIAKWEDLRAVKDVVDYGVHGMYHDCFSSMSVEELELSIINAKSRLTSELGHYPLSIAYPYGDPLCVTERQIREVIAQHFKFGFSAIKGVSRNLNAVATMLLPRCFVTNRSAADLRNQLRRRFSDAASFK